MKRIYCIIFCCMWCFSINAQPLPENTRRAFHAAKTDTEKGKVLVSYFDSNVDENDMMERLILLKNYFEKNNDPVNVDYVSLGICRQISRGKEYAQAIDELFQLLPRFEKRKDAYGTMVCNRHLSYAYYAAGDSTKTLYYDRKTVELAYTLGAKDDIAIACNNIAADLAEYGYFDSAFIYAQKAIKAAHEINDSLLIGKTFSTMAEGYIARKRYDSAVFYIRKSLPIAKNHSRLDYVYGLNDFAEVFLATHQNDSAIYNATLAVDMATQINLMNQVLRAYTYLATAYKGSGPLDSAYKYLELSVNTKDSLYGADKKKQVQMIDMREQNRQRDIDQQALEMRNKIKIYALIGGLAVITLIGFILYRNSNKEKKAKLLLQRKNNTIEQTLSDLKAAQSQLVQAEKMASLGELTAGIAHEIQNPLNFVNNFSEVNAELIAELLEETAKGNLEEVKAIANDIKDNEEKITHHGKRADAIVKGMLQHSRSGGSIKEPTDINKLADEYLRLAYHGTRAKDNSFNVTLKTDFDESIGNINIVSQDIGRVIMNLLTNAFYACAEKEKQMTTDHGQQATAEPYKPTVAVSTKKIGNSIEIKVSDNGNGIPKHIVDKIFQPFFTTKPTGQGTGLGLSLSYDIITKAHGGTLRVETNTTPEETGTTFIIQLPLEVKV